MVWTVLSGYHSDRKEVVLGASTVPPGLEKGSPLKISSKMMVAIALHHRLE